MKDDDLIATPSQTVGPFFHVGLGPARSRVHGDAPATAGERISLHVRVQDGDGEMVPDALIEAWTSTGFARQPTDQHGCAAIEIARAPYVNICVFARGLLRHLQTRAYFDAAAVHEADAVMRLVPESRRQTLLARADERQPGLWLFDIRLQGAHETVFFDA